MNGLESTTLWWLGALLLTAFLWDLIGLLIRRGLARLQAWRKHRLIRREQWRSWNEFQALRQRAAQQRSDF
jgi:hypothetical protein